MKTIEYIKLFKAAGMSRNSILTIRKMLMMDRRFLFVGFVMLTETENESDFKDRAAATMAGIFFIIQFVIFMYNYNFNGLSFLTWIGWLLLIPGFLLISLSESTLKTHRMNGFYSLLRHPFSVGWLMMSVALVMISQNWFSFFCMGIQLPFIIFRINRRKIVQLDVREFANTE